MSNFTVASLKKKNYFYEFHKVVDLKKKNVTS